MMMDFCSSSNFIATVNVGRRLLVESGKDRILRNTVLYEDHMVNGPFFWFFDAYLCLYKKLAYVGNYLCELHLSFRIC